MNTDARTPTSIVDWERSILELCVEMPRGLQSMPQLKYSTVLPDQDARRPQMRRPEVDTGLAPDATTDAGSMPMTDMMLTRRRGADGCPTARG